MSTLQVMAIKTAICGACFFNVMLKTAPSMPMAIIWKILMLVPFRYTSFG